MGLLDNNKTKTVIIPEGYRKQGFSILKDLEDYTIACHINRDSNDRSREDPDHKSLQAVWKNVAVFVKEWGTKLYISTDGIDGDTQSVDFNSTNFPNLISGSSIELTCIVGYARRTAQGSSHTYSDTSWRVVVFTDKGQIYHNFPSHHDDYDGAVEEGDMLRFDESVVWDLPNRKTPVKTSSGDDATLIASGVYKYMPCLPVGDVSDTDNPYNNGCSPYDFHPGLNVSNGYGNTGFGAVRSYTDKDNTSKKRARFFVPVRGVAQANSFHWLNGLMQGSQMTVIGTYRSNASGGVNVRTCTFATNDGREWFVQYEYGPNSACVYFNDQEQEVSGIGAVNLSTEYYGEYSRLKWDTNSMTDGSAFVLKKRMSYVPSADEKEPTDKFKYGESVAVSSIVSSSDGIVVTTSTAHGLSNGDTYIIESAGGNVSWDWICSHDHSTTSGGNGTIWSAVVVDSTHLRLSLEIKNPDNNLFVRHIHAISPCKDGYVISCGEGYPNGWIEYVQIKETDNYNNLFAGNSYPVIRLTSASSSVYRTLGFVFTEQKNERGGNLCFFGSDHYDLDSGNVEMPSGRTVEFKRNSTGVYSCALKDVDDFSKADCLYETDEPCYHFSETEGVMIFLGMRQTLALSRDRGKSWITVQLPPEFYSFSWLEGVSENKEICITTHSSLTSAPTLIIKPKF